MTRLRHTSRMSTPALRANEMTMPVTTFWRTSGRQLALWSLPMAFFADAAWAQPGSPIYRCGNEYTNQPGDHLARGCRLVEGGHLTVVKPGAPATVTSPGAPRPTAVAAPASKPDRAVVDVAQRERDRDARLILVAELRKAEAHLQSLQEASRQPSAVKEDDWKARLERAAADVDAIRRELERAAPGR